MHFQKAILAGLACLFFGACGANENTPVEAPMGPRECAAVCGQGEAGAPLLANLSERATFAGGCYDEVVKDGKSTGKMVVNLVITEEGSVCRAALAEDTTGSADLGRCVMSRLSSGTYPVPAQGCVVINVPLSFRPGEAKPSPCSALLAVINEGVNALPEVKSGDEAAPSLRAFADAMAAMGDKAKGVSGGGDAANALRDEYLTMTGAIASSARALADAMDKKDEEAMKSARTTLQDAVKQEGPLVEKINNACQNEEPKN